MLGDVVAAFLRRHLGLDQKLVVGLSGGRDSIVLLHILQRLQSRFEFHLSACHVNHGLSPRAEEWQLFCQRVCAEWGISLTVNAVDIPRSSAEGLEAAARNRRYAVFSEISADWLVLAQHRGDLAETTLFNLLRGTGLAGMASMPETRLLRPGLGLMRPMLGVARFDIDAYLERHHLDWVEDESNQNTGFSRNFLRHEVLPLLLSRFPAAEKKLASAVAHFSEAKSLLDQLAIIDLGEHPPEFPVPLECFARLSEPRGRNLLRFLLFRHGTGIPSEERLIEAVRQLLEAKQDRHPAVVFGDKQLCRKRGRVHLEPINAAERLSVSI
ncbi:MAG: tRNA lysidine(34) synthetase TilS [Betaproteobacteria bacterium]|nr:tRNA lysidine(34) synthetase TilS [Betaproteobacteria bacterium]